MDDSFLRTNALIKEFLAFNNYTATLQCLEAEEKVKPRPTQERTRLVKLLER